MLIALRKYYPGKTERNHEHLRVSGLCSWLIGNPSKQAAAGICLGPHDHQDQHNDESLVYNFCNSVQEATFFFLTVPTVC